MRRLCHLARPAEPCPLMSRFYSLHLSFLYGRLCGCLICGETNDSDSPNLARYQSHSESNTSREGVRVQVCVSAVCVCPVSPITPLGSVTLWQRALIFQFYHTPLSQLSPVLLSSLSSSLWHFFSLLTGLFHTQRHTHIHTHTLDPLISSMRRLKGAVSWKFRVKQIKEQRNLKVEKYLSPVFTF